MNEHERIASEAMLDVARSWVSIDAPDEEVSPRELALWLASWRNDLVESMGDVGADGPFMRLVAEAMAVDGNCAPHEFVEWFMDWRERGISTLVGSGRGKDIAGIPLHGALSLLAFQFEDDLHEEVIDAARAAIDGIEREGFGAVGCDVAVRVAKELLLEVSHLPPRADVITRVYRGFVVDMAHDRLSEHGRLIMETAPHVPSPEQCRVRKGHG